ncbi:MAG: peptide chain release factor N(5)-glutamine methyltransferase [Chromatiaceae bacterium]
MDPSIGTTLCKAADRLAHLPDAAPRLEAELLLAQATGLSRTRLLTWPDRALEPATLGAYWTLVDRRRNGEPIAYIRGYQDFWSLQLRVTPDTLIPRPETELLVALVLARLPAARPLKVADAGSGSGAIAAAIAHERPNWWLIATEHGAAAALIAQDNLRRFAPGNAPVVRGDWLEAIAPGSLDAVISNPPYIAEADPHLTQGDLRFEPRSALVGGPDGLGTIRRLAAEATTRLHPGGLVVLEHGYDQGPAVRGILAAAGYVDIETHRDLAGHERATLAHWPRRTGTQTGRLGR